MRRAEVAPANSGDPHEGTRYNGLTMVRLGPINLQRVQWVAEDQDIDPADLGSFANLPASTWEKVLRGEDGLTFAQLQKLGKRVGRQPLFFLDPRPVDEQNLRSVQFRNTIQNATEVSGELKRLIERSERQREIYTTLREDADDPGPHRFTPPVKTGDSPETAAQKVRAWLEMPDEPTRTVSFGDYRAALEDKDVLVLLATGYAGDWKFPNESSVIGFSIYFDTAPLIMVRNCDWKSRELFTLAHELGHLVLHRQGTVTRESDLRMTTGREREANAFAGHLLVPDTFVKLLERIPLGRDVSAYDDLFASHRKLWGVSTEVVLRRLMEVGSLPRALYLAYRGWREQQPRPASTSGGNRGYRNREPLHRFGQRYVRTVLDAVSDDRITVDRASDYLDRLQIKDVRKLEEHVKGL